MNEAIDMQMVQTRGDIFEEGVDLFETQFPPMKFLRRVCLILRPSPDALFERLVRFIQRRGIDNVLVKITGIAILLQDEDAWYAWAECRYLDVFEPNVLVID